MSAPNFPPGVARILAEEIRADRALVALVDGNELVLHDIHGMEAPSLEYAPVSLSVVEDAVRQGKTILSNDARWEPELNSTLTLQLSAAVSVLCVPITDACGDHIGALYADTMRREGAFRHPELSYARQLATWFEATSQGRRVDRPGLHVTGATEREEREEAPAYRPPERKGLRLLLAVAVIGGLVGAAMMMMRPKPKAQPKGGYPVAQVTEAVSFTLEGTLRLEKNERATLYILGTTVDRELVLRQNGSFSCSFDLRLRQRPTGLRIEASIGGRPSRSSATLPLPPESSVINLGQVELKPVDKP